ncbi:mechanosensitive ion channel domain-containing protein [Pseudomarimonas salicorniae]|uniref:Mechanosensitive ion channel n=1 Tax=Pseudomarimonas salicorniae TaxID=2933270 RepID=A0ABT0GJ10_9GAMM|nr:mechanosensitive ion channel domain-containing protein [Lysobacter sp. CAU 1642]MCK7594549.1 mechanosensitive ion channel [Lysobacter sp. CAU 1642]
MTSRDAARAFMIALGLALLAQMSPAGAQSAADEFANRLESLEAAVKEEGAVAEADLPPTRQALLQARQSVERLRAAVEFDRTGAERVRRLEAAAARDVSEGHAEWLRGQPANPSRAALEAALQEAQTRIGEERQKLVAARARIGSGEAGVFSSERLAELDARLDALARQPAPLPPKIQAEQLSAQAEIAAIQREQAGAELRWRESQAQLAAAQTAIAMLELRIAALQERIAGSDLRAARQLQETLAETRRNIEDPFLNSVAEDTEALAGRLLEQIERLAEDRQVERSTELAREAAARSLTAVRSRIGVDASGESLGALLLAERRGLDKPQRLLARLESLRADIAELRLRLLELPREAQWPVRPDQGDDEPAAAAPADSATPEPLRLRSILRGQRQSVEQRLGDTLQRRLETLTRTEVALRRQLEDTRTLERLLDEQLLWLPSHPPISAAWWARLPTSAADLWAPGRWQRSLELLAMRLADRPAGTLLGLGTFIALLVLRRRAQARIEALAPPLRHDDSDRYALTAAALGWTLVAALPWPLLVGLVGHHLSLAGEAGKFTHSLGITLTGVAVTGLLFTILKTLVRERGLAHLHFRWTRSRRESLAWRLPLLAAVTLVLQFHVLLSFTRGVDLAIGGAARAASVLFALFAAAVLWRNLGPGRWWSPRGRSEPFKLRQVLRVALPLACLWLALLLVQGYVFSAAILLGCLWQTLWLVLAVALLHGMLSRWMLLGERRLARRRLQQQREAQAAQDPERSVDEAPEVSEELIPIESVNAQTSRLLRAITLSVMAAGLLWIWSDVYPAFERLDAINLWQFSDVDDQGQAVRGDVTLRALILGLLALVLTWVAARNLPGLLEIGLLSRIRIDAASRYAIASVSRYFIIIAGMMIGLGLLGLRWSQLQWMAAAFSVGLGFGLQEIFGNFVSGLILLFERPFRVGDVITIGEYTGTVSKIRTRATTLVDWDNKEVVIPNKVFITDRLINWTLSDTRTRIILKVGVAYGSDLALVHRLLRQAADEHPTVLREPAPASWFLSFGPSSLDFELRVFVESLADRLPTTNALNTRIAQLFAEHGIEIAFPQMDLHVRDMPRERPGGPAADQDSAAQGGGEHP